MGIAYSTFRSWRDKFSAISAVLKKGRDGTKMPIRYKVDILEALKSKGYSTYKLRQGKTSCGTYSATNKRRNIGVLGKH